MKEKTVAVILGCLISLIPILSSAQTKEPIKIGAVYTFSGATATLCKSILEGHKMAAEQINKAGGLLGRKIEFIVRDDGGNPEVMTRHCRELITKEGVDWLFAGIGTIPSLAASAVAKQFKIPTFIHGGHSELITIEEWNPYIFRYSVTTRAEGRMCAQILEQVLRNEKNPTVYYISWDYEYGHTLWEPLKERLKEVFPSLKIVGEAWPRVGETDYGPFINQILATQPTVIVNGIWGGAVVSLVKQMNQMGVFAKSKFFSMALIGSIEYRLIYGLNMPEGTWSNAYDDPVWPDNEAQHEFYQMYRDYSGNKKDPVPSHILNGYNMMQLVAAAIRKANTLETQAVIKAMEGISIDTYQGPIMIRDFDHQTLVGNIWAPMIKKPGLPYLVLDPTQAKWEPIAPALVDKDEWLRRREAAKKK